jgi:hypothetical protein
VGARVSREFSSPIRTVCHPTSGEAFISGNKSHFYVFEYSNITPGTVDLGYYCQTLMS